MSWQIGKSAYRLQIEHLHIRRSTALCFVKDSLALLVLVHHTAETIVGNEDDFLAAGVLGHEEVGRLDISVGDVTGVEVAHPSHLYTNK